MSIFSCHFSVVMKLSNRNSSIAVFRPLFSIRSSDFLALIQLHICHTNSLSLTTDICPLFLHFWQSNPFRFPSSAFSRSAWLCKNFALSKHSVPDEYLACASAIISHIVGIVSTPLVIRIVAFPSDKLLFPISHLVSL